LKQAITKRNNALDSSKLNNYHKEGNILNDTIFYFEICLKAINLLPSETHNLLEISIYQTKAIDLLI